MLPQKWVIKRDKTNYEIINKYFHQIRFHHYTSNGRWQDKNARQYTHDFLIFPHLLGKTVFQNIPSSYIEVSFEDFKRECLGEITHYQIY